MNEDIRTSAGRLRDSIAAVDKALSEVCEIVVISPFSINYVDGAISRLTQARELLEFAYSIETREVSNEHTEIS
jgi:hypothetical protein